MWDTGRGQPLNRGGRLRGKQPCRYLIWDLQASRSKKSKLCCLSPPVCGSLLGQPWETNTGVKKGCGKAGSKPLAAIGRPFTPRVLLFVTVVVIGVRMFGSHKR